MRSGPGEGVSSETDDGKGGRSDISPSLDTSADMHGRGGDRPQR